MKKDEDDPSLEKMHFAEDFGLLFEREGLPRMAGRILGWLLVSESPHQSLYELAEVLHASKGSISGMTRMLIQMGLIERIAVPGHRRDYVRIKARSWLPLMEEQIATFSALRQLAERGLGLLEGTDPEARRRLAEIRDLYTFLEEEFPALLEHWEKRRKVAAR